VGFSANVFFFRDYIESGSVYVTPDSGGECGVPYETYFPMPTSAKDKPWYSIEQGSVHFTVISTEHDWSQKSEQVRIIKRLMSFMFISLYNLISLSFKYMQIFQHEWMKNDMASIDRSKTPWLVFTG
jgi:acid phosphatase type 7